MDPIELVLRCFPESFLLYLLAVAVPVVLILEGRNAIMRGKVKLFGHHFRGAAATVIGVTLVLIGVFAGVVVLQSVVASIGELLR